MMQGYTAYKESGVDWLGKVPTGWELQRNKFIFEEKTKVVGKNAKKFKLLSLTLGGVIPRDMENPKGKFPAEFNTYKQVSENDLVFCLFDVEETPRAVGIAGESGMITGAYTVLKTNPDTNPSFVNYFYLSLDDEKQLKSLYTGLRNVIKIDTFMSMKTPFPDIDIQTAIAKFLDDKTAKIDELVGIKRRQIELLAERKQILIQNAVTKGLNPNATMKDSGVDWLGEIPSHWDVKPGTVAFFENKRNNKGMKQDQVLSLSYGNIIIKSKEKLFGLVPESFETYQIIEAGDIIIRGTDLQNDKTSLRTGLAKDEGIITSAYLSLRVRPNFNANFLHYYLHALDTTKVIYKLGTGLRQNLSFEDFKRLSIFEIPLPEQTAIAKFLDDKTAKIDDATTIKQNQISKLNEYKTTLINAAVTGKIKVI